MEQSLSLHQPSPIHLLFSPTSPRPPPPPLLPSSSLIRLTSSTPHLFLVSLLHPSPLLLPLTTNTCPKRL